MYRLMIVEDEMIERMVLKKMLQKKFGEECQILEAQNGNEAVEIFKREEIQVVILDIGMPGMNGIQAAEIMRKEKKDCCLIFLTAYDRFDYAKKAISIRAMEYLLKPYSQREVLGVVEEALRLTKEREGRPGEIKVQKAEEESDAPTEKEKLQPVGEDESDFNGNRLSVMTSMVEEYIRINFMNDLSMSETARAVGYSEPYFCRMFKLQFGQSFTSYLAEYRVREAKKLLVQPNVNVKEVGVRVGYADSNYFTKVFKRLEGVNPSEYRIARLKDLQSY
ncbi:response regulator transcription factor [Lacrimispora saccharolytica]|uniref:Stage 0 sporulation protein A homolog n=1 Tax=Lacrimispora saccharolytica (strain ATCC 35040 / DSM 2544 / NRCC 2533 / WM1) TaxID=610130 RepID=D9R4C6_LACSW|nr:response regulator [Lacrimispora saccharolytica]ADL04996.1 two component transcriptional regulator, AraC family [[Clostridium] saccharolyticum WM1]QRV20803.1 response regulator [Lacrimispora saccharolytica]